MKYHYWCASTFPWFAACGYMSSTTIISGHSGNCDLNSKFNCLECLNSDIYKQDKITFELVYNGHATQEWISFIEKRKVWK